MMYTSTRGELNYTLSQAILEGLAPDGGLFVPSSFPHFSPSDFEGMSSYTEIGVKFLRPFFTGDPLERHLDDILEYTFSFEIPLRKLDDCTYMLELFHGPTGAFKDVGARFLARCFEHLDEERTILVATSGDTGSAVASAFYGLERTRAVILFPKGKISEFQERQLTCWDRNILSLRVRGDFDDCQRIVKEIFNDASFASYGFSSANSINIGRLLPQCLYYVVSSLQHFRESGQNANYIVPTGNMGNVLACVYARHMGFPIGNIVLACNKNKTIPHFFLTGRYEPRESVPTLANAMDVGAPSNMERYLDLVSKTPVSDIIAFSVNDEEIVEGLKETYRRYRLLVCPHTAVGFVARQQLDEEYIIVSTAHASKFSDVVGSAVGKEVDLAPQLEHFARRAINFREVDPTVSSVLKEIKGFLKR